MDTINCVACGKPAVVWSGRVMHGKRLISAGWCSEACMNLDRKGRCGEWRPSMGITARGKPATTNVCHCGPSCPVWRSDRRFCPRIFVPD